MNTTVQQQKTRLSISDYCKKVNIAPKELVGECRQDRVSVPRQIYWYYLRHIGYTYQKIGEIFNRTHPTVRYGIQNIGNMIETYDPILFPYEEFLSTYCKYNKKMKTEVQENFATVPAENGCEGCFFQNTYQGADECHLTNLCFGHKRPDKKSIIFKKER